MKLKLLKVTVVAMLTLLGVGCVLGKITKGKTVFQTFEFGNDGQGIVRDVKVQYGSLVIPSGTAHRDYDPNHMTPVSESRDAPIPESAQVHWISADGKVHDVSAPIRSFVSNPSCFYGFRFFFVDDHVDIYVMNREVDCTHLLSVERTKVFSSKTEQ